MKNEVLRQLVHLSGLAFILFAQLIDKTNAGIIFFLIALFFLLYSEYVSKCEKNHKTLLSKIECRLRDFTLFFERKDTKKPFTGPFWFYIGLGLAFLLFPLNVASAAGATLAISDSLSTIIGMRFGKKKILGKKTYEGTASFFITAFFACLFFVNPFAAMIGAVAATFSELLPEARWVSSKGRGFFDDNLLIPIIAGFAISIAVIL